MKTIKLTAVVLAAICSLGTALAQDSTQVAEHETLERHAKFQFSLFPPVSTQGTKAHLYTNDASLNILVGVSKNINYFTASGLVDVVLNNATGVQLAGLMNYVGGDGLGYQSSGLVNINKGRFTGLQMAGLANFAGDVRGAQIGGMFNVAGNVRGTQIGFVNVADHNNVPIGLVNIIKDGEMGVTMGYNEIGTASLTFRSGGRVTYGILGLGYNHNIKDPKEALGIITGLGANINILPWFRIHNELTMEAVGLGMFGKRGGETLKASYALPPAFRLWHVEIFGGPSINYMQSSGTAGPLRSVFPKQSIWKRESNGGNRLQQAFVGWQVGVQFFW